MPGVSVANDKESAKRIIDLLYLNRNYYHAADTETIDIDAKNESPVGILFLFSFRYFITLLRIKVEI